MNADSKPVFFTIDMNVTSFPFSVFLEAQCSGSIDVGMALASITCVWNATQNCYVLDAGAGFFA